MKAAERAVFLLLLVGKCAISNSAAVWQLDISLRFNAHTHNEIRSTPAFFGLDIHLI